MSSPIVSLLPSQNEFDSLEIALDCFQKLKMMTLAVIGTAFEKYADQLTSQQYFILVRDLVEIGHYHLERTLKATQEQE